MLIRKGWSILLFLTMCGASMCTPRTTCEQRSNHYIVLYFGVRPYGKISDGRTMITRKSTWVRGWKANPYGGASQAKDIVLEEVGVEAKQPNSAICKCVGVQLIKNCKKVMRDCCLNHIEENVVLVAVFGSKGHAVGYIPGVGFKVVKVANLSLLALEKEERPRS